jgi:flagellar secretion chaperone FliS
MRPNPFVKPALAGTAVAQTVQVAPTQRLLKTPERAVKTPQIGAKDAAGHTDKSCTLQEIHMMFTAPTVTFASGPKKTAPGGAYRQIGVSTAVDGASPHKLVSLLFDALLSDITCARGAMARGDIAEKGRAIGHAVRILQEGLIAPLDMQAGGAVAQNLNDVYDYVVRRLTHANLNNDAQALAECHALIVPIQDAWSQIRSSVASSSAPTSAITRAAV